MTFLIPSKTVVEVALHRALTKLGARDVYLVSNGVNERSVTHKLAEYLQQEFPKWDVDCEYNRDGPDTKVVSIPNQNLELEDNPVFPDIIIHKRGDWYFAPVRPHVLVIEARKRGSRLEKIQRDEAKVAAYISQLKYCYGVLVEYWLANDKLATSIEWRENA